MTPSVSKSCLSFQSSPEEKVKQDATQMFQRNRSNSLLIQKGVMFRLILTYPGNEHKCVTQCRMIH